ncbi:MAG: 4-diphosphocytidyl-2-C-methyl-D-erythritol kinase [Phycisphaerae bacterium]|nr:4-diphosphocytidyl-2-C-methyl-D-erythritol kinase [Phycisphaerae bacterium]
MTNEQRQAGPTTREFSLRAPAKLNLTLHVVGRRPDGFHDLRSLVCGVDLCDEVIARADAGGAMSVACDVPALSGPDNLVVRAVEALREISGCRLGLSVGLFKRIPIGAGLGGGSSDAAAALRLARTAWGLPLSDDLLTAAGARIGSDVPLFLKLPSAVITGRGEQVRAVRLAWRGFFLLIHADDHVPTADVYGVFRRRVCRRPPQDRTEEALQATSAAELSVCLHNDLEESVYLLHPRLKALKEQAARLLGRTLHLTGAGSTWFAPLDDEADAKRLAERIHAAKLGLRAEVVGGLTSAPVVEERG